MRGHTDKSELKTKYRADFEKVQRLVNEFDPCDFIQFGAPIDEYDSLTNQLLSAIYNEKIRTEIKDLILYEIEHHLGSPDIKILNEPQKTHFYKDRKSVV